ncbi:hypothetical protein ABZ379_44180, partial [Streptomyces canus]|uniref:hypothetical protein n=1 Tax=Streptomyces canus TaxID=58343 RepID=UPI0033D0B8DC
MSRGGGAYRPRCCRGEDQPPDTGRAAGEGVPRTIRSGCGGRRLPAGVTGVRTGIMDGRQPTDRN